MKKLGIVLGFLFIISPIILNDLNAQSARQPIIVADCATITHKPAGGRGEIYVDVAGALCTGATFTGDITIGAVTVTSGHIITDTGSVTKLEASTAVIGHVVVDSGGGIAWSNSNQVTANAGTNLNTSALALESGGNLALLVTSNSRLTSSAGAVGGASTLGTTFFLGGGEYHSTPLTLTDTKQAELQLDNHGLLLVNCTGCSSSGSITSWGGGTLGAMANYGTSPGAVLVPGMNAFITNVPHVVVDSGASSSSITSWGGGTLGAMANYGTSPGAVLVPGVNANVTNLTVDSADNAAFTEAPLGIGGMYAATPADHTDGDKATILTDIKGHVIVVNNGTFVTQSAITAAAASFATGSLNSAIPDPCVTGTKAFFPVNIATATTTVIHAAVTSNKFYICSYDFVAAGAQTITFIEGTGGTCGSSTAGVTGGTSAATGYSFAVNGGISKGNGLGSIAATATAAHDLCLITGQSAQISGTVAYVTAP